MIPRFLKNIIKKQYFKWRGLYTVNPLLVSSDIQVERPVFIGENTRVEYGVSMGKYSYINSGCIFCKTRIGRFCSIGWNVTIGAPEHPTDWLSTSPIQYAQDGIFSWNGETRYFDSEVDFVTIGHDVWIGANAFIKRGVSIGNGAIIAAGAVVVHDVPDYTIVGGVPAKIIRNRFNGTVIKKMQELQWWLLPDNVIGEMPCDDIDACIEYVQNINLQKAHHE